MSVARNNNSKFCKVCLDAGKPESEYKSHFTRETKDVKSVVICPTLLALECRYCFKSGHTVKYCSSLKQKTATQPNNKFKSNPSNNIKSKSKGKPIETNKFAYLQWDSDEEEQEQEITSKEIETTEDMQYPSLTYFKPSYKISSVLNYAAALTAIPISEPIQETKIQVKIKKTEHVDTKPAPWANKTKQDVRTMSWADMESDSEDEDNSAW